MTYTISPTQIESFDPSQGGCERKWAFRKIDKIPSPPNQYAQAGLDLHAVAEAWLRDGTPPDLTTPAGQAFNGGMHHLPLIKTVDVEQRATFEYLDVHYDQRIDYLRFTPNTEVALIGDHKSTGDLQWSDEKLAALTGHTDPQWLMYGMWAVETLGAQWVHGEWIYYLRRPPWSSRKLEVKASDWTIIEKFEQHIHPVSLRILAALNEPSDARPKNLEACGRYGGCPYKDRCLNGVSKAKRIAAMSTEPSNTLEAARARLAARAQESIGKPAANVTGGLAERLRQRREAQATAPAAPPPEPVVDVTTDWIPAKSGGPLHVASIEVDEAAKAAQIKAKVDSMREEIAAALELETAEPTAADTIVAEIQLSDTVNAVLDQATAEPPKRKRGRPRKPDEVSVSKEKKVVINETQTVGRVSRALADEMVEQEYREKVAAIDAEIERRMSSIRKQQPTTATVGHVGPSAVVEVPENTPSGPIGYVTTGTMVDAADFIGAQRQEDYREILTRLHVAAIAAHAPPEVAGAHFDAILDKLEQGR